MWMVLLVGVWLNMSKVGIGNFVIVFNLDSCIIGNRL